MTATHPPLDAEPDAAELSAFREWKAARDEETELAADRAARQPAPPVFGLVLGLADVDAAFEAEIHRVSHLEYASDDICRWFFSNVRNRLAALIQPQDDLARSSSEAPAPQAQQRSLPSELLDRIESALQRHLNDHAPKRIPADPSDTDLVLYDLRQWRQGKSPGWWGPQPPQGGSAKEVRDD